MRVLEEASKVAGGAWNKWQVSRGFTKVGLSLALVTLGLIILSGLSIWSFTKVVQGLTTGGFRNRDLYIPRIRR